MSQTYVVVDGNKFSVYRDRKRIDRGVLNYEPGQGPMGHSREMDCLALAAEIAFTNSLVGVPNVFQVFRNNAPTVIPWVPRKID